MPGNICDHKRRVPRIHIQSMATLRIYRNPDCERCAKIARFHKRWDWRHRLEFSVLEPRSGPLVPGEVVVEEIATGQVLSGFPAFAAICRAIPAYLPFRLLFVFRGFRRYAAREISAGKITDA